jgi:hypothetical protein
LFLSFVLAQGTETGAVLLTLELAFEVSAAVPRAGELPGDACLSDYLEQASAVASAMLLETGVQVGGAAQASS